MKESTSSIRLYFILVGFGWLLSVIASIFYVDVLNKSFIYTIVGAITSLGYFLVALFLSKLLNLKEGLAIKIFLGITLLVSFLINSSTTFLILAGVTVYLFININRLGSSKGVQESTPAQNIS